MAKKPAASKASSDVVEKKATAVVPAGMNFEADAGKGQEGADKASYAIPFLTMLQGQSPQIETVDGAKPGLLINTISNELFKEAIVIPCAYQRRFIRWAPRAKGGGYKGEFNPIEVETRKLPGLSYINGQYLMDVPKDASQWFDEKGTPLFDHLADTRNHFVLVQNEHGQFQPALMSMASTQIKKSKRWMSRIQGLELLGTNGKPFNPPSFSHTYTITGVKEENAKGHWWGLSIELTAPVADPDVYARAQDFYKSVVAGQVEVSMPEQEHEGGGDDDRGGF